MIQSQHAGGMLLTPVQTLVSSSVSARRAEMQTSPVIRTKYKREGECLLFYTSVKET